jgi:hypothetical protein
MSCIELTLSIVRREELRRRTGEEECNGIWWYALAHQYIGRYTTCEILYKHIWATLRVVASTSRFETAVMLIRAQRC